MTAPSNPNTTPPGYYMLFILNSNGVPSVAKILQISATASSPTPTPRASSTPTATAPPTPTPTATRTPTPTPTPTPRATPTPTPAPSPSPTPTKPPTPTAPHPPPRPQPPRLQRPTATPTGSPSPSSTPAAPSNLSATAAGCLDINLSWIDKSNNETGFKIERSVDNVTFTQIATTSANITTYTSHQTSAGLRYFRVRAYNANGNSLYSNTVSSQSGACPTATPTPTLAARRIRLRQQQLSDRVRHPQLLTTRLPQLLTSGLRTFYTRQNTPTATATNKGRVRHRQLLTRRPRRRLQQLHAYANEKQKSDCNFDSNQLNAKPNRQLQRQVKPRPLLPRKPNCDKAKPPLQRSTPTATATATYTPTPIPTPTDTPNTDRGDCNIHAHANGRGLTPRRRPRPQLGEETPSATATATETPSATETPIVTPTATETPLATATPTESPAPTETPTPSCLRHC